LGPSSPAYLQHASAHAEQRSPASRSTACLTGCRPSACRLCY